jgi:SAM-dependent methyltransferase
VSVDFEAIKQGHRNMWAVGDYPSVATRIQPVADTLARRVGAAPGRELLDVATGSGNVALAAAKSGASVTGLDITPELLDAARRRAAAAGAQIEFVEGDAEQLPFADSSFDLVTSCFGVMFAPRQQLAARELVRVARPGGAIAVTAWTPDGLAGRQFRVSASYMPPPPTELKPPVAWGEETHVRALFADSGAEVTCERASVEFAAESARAWYESDEDALPPAVMAKAALEPQGRYEALRRDMIALYEEVNEADDGSFRARAEYLLTLVRVPA